MLREEEIKKAIEHNLDVSIYTPEDGEMLKEAFYLGARWADNNPNLESLWHDATTQPELNKWFLAQIGDDAFDTFVMAMDKNQYWKEWANGINIKRWAYIDDLLPKGYR